MAKAKSTTAAAKARTDKDAKAAKARTDKDAKTLAKIQKLAQSVVSTVIRGSNPALSIRTRALSNVAFNEKKRIIELGDRAQSREFFNTAMARKFMQTFMIANGCKTLLD